jgi:hypothetical protein
MLRSVMRDISLAIRAKSGLTPAVFVWMAVVLFAAFGALLFLCVAGYNWLSSRFDAIDAALIMAGIFVVIAVFGAVIAVMIRRGARERAILERAARSQAPTWLLDPKFLTTVLQVGRSVGWERIIPVALVGLLAAQWARERRDGHNRDKP